MPPRKKKEPETPKQQIKKSIPTQNQPRSTPSRKKKAIEKVLERSETIEISSPQKPEIQIQPPQQPPRISE